MTVHRPRYGRYLEEFREGAHWWHPRSVTVPEALAHLFAAGAMEANPLYLSRRDARRAGHERPPVHPHLVLALVMALGVEGDSEQTRAYLGYRELRFLRPLYPGDTLRAATRVLEVRDRGPDRPGVVRIETVGVDQREVPVVAYQRAVLIPHRPDGAPDRWSVPGPDRPFLAAAGDPWRPDPSPDWPGPPELAPGDVVLHPRGRTVTDQHQLWAHWTGNPNPIHFDRLESRGREGPLRGEPVAYGVLVMAWVAGLAGRDLTASALWEPGPGWGRHTAPVRSGDTLAAVSRVEAVERGETGTLIVCSLAGLIDLPAEEAWDRHGAALFDPEAAVPERCLIASRRLLYRR